jgi:hypothetical protein
VQTRYFCPTCKVEFVDGGYVLMHGQQSRWREEDGCPRCHCPVQHYSFRPAVIGLDLPRDEQTGLVTIVPVPPPSAVAEATQPATLRDDRHARNDVLAPDPRELQQPPTAVEPWQWI